MGERNQPITAIMDCIKETLDKKTPEQLADETAIKDATVKELINKYSTDSFKLNVDLIYRADTSFIPTDSDPQLTMEERGSIGQDKDYQLLLSLKTKGYRDKSVSEFLQDYIELAQNPHFKEACTNVFRDIFLNDVQVDISDEDITFLKTTFEATSQEFIAQYHYSNELPTLRYSIEEQKNEVFNGSNIIVFDLNVDYDISYAVLNDTELTVAERDNILINIQKDIQKFIDDKTEDELINSKQELEKKANELEEKYSNNKIKIKINIISYQVHDERDDIKSLQ